MKNTAIILSGALAKGAFEAGSLSVVIQNPNIKIKSIVATSSGALNATALAAGITSGRVEKAIDILINTWIEKGTWYNVLDFSFKKMINRQGLCTSNRLRLLIKNTVEQFITSDVYPIELKFVLTQLSGHMGFIAGKPNTTFESIASFNNMDFFYQKRREQIYTAAVASAAFPGLFAPVDVPGFGACYDGGIVNDTPIKYALESHYIDQIIVISPFPAISASIDEFKGLNLASRFGDILVNERLYRDLLTAEKTNEIISRLKLMLASKELTKSQFAKIHQIFHNKHNIDIIQIRPKKKLEGNGFSGLFNKDLRIQYIKEGIKAAKEILQQATSINI